jgi:hypothetical protein
MMEIYREGDNKYLDYFIHFVENLIPIVCIFLNLMIIILGIYLKILIFETQTQRIDYLLQN